MMKRESRNLPTQPSQNSHVPYCMLHTSHKNEVKK
jgi:hypothetical protein